MKYVLIVGDGMADLPLPALGGKTPLEALALPGMNRVAGGELGRVRTCPPSLPAGSDVAFLSLFGQDVAACYTGRSPLEAAGEGVLLRPGEVSMRMNLASLGDDFSGGTMLSYNGDGIDGEDARRLVSDLIAHPPFADLMARAQMRIHPSPTFRHVTVVEADSAAPFSLTPPHDIAGRKIAEYLPAGERSELLRELMAVAHAFLSAHAVNRARVVAGHLPANGAWFWGAGTAATLSNFSERWQLTGTAVSAVPLVRGIARLCGLSAPNVPGATGTLETNYEGKVAAALAAIERDDYVLLHLEAPDDMSHLGDLEGKLEAIRRLDARMVRPVMAALDASGQDYRLMVMPDHYTLLSTCAHDGRPVPYAIYDSRRPTAARAYCEAACEGEEELPDGSALLRRFFER